MSYVDCACVLSCPSAFVWAFVFWGGGYGTQQINVEHGLNRWEQVCILQPLLRILVPNFGRMASTKDCLHLHGLVELGLEQHLKNEESRVAKDKAKQCHVTQMAKK